jgi:hypothetical protein
MLSLKPDPGYRLPVRSGATRHQQSPSDDTVIRLKSKPIACHFDTLVRDFCVCDILATAFLAIAPKLYVIA